MRYIGLLLVFFWSCSSPPSSGLTSLPAGKQKHFVPFNPETVNDPVDYYSENFVVQEITAEEVKILANQFNYTWVVVWAPWCPGPETEKFSSDYLQYEKQLKEKGVKLIFVAVGYGPEGIKSMAQKLNYSNLTFVIADQPGGDNLKAFHSSLNSKWAYRNANHYIFKKDKGLIYTEKAPVMTLETLQRLIK